MLEINLQKMSTLLTKTFKGYKLFKSLEKFKNE